MRSAIVRAAGRLGPRAAGPRRRGGQATRALGLWARLSPASPTDAQGRDLCGDLARTSPTIISKQTKTSKRRLNFTPMSRYVVQKKHNKHKLVLLSEIIVGEITVKSPYE